MLCAWPGRLWRKFSGGALALALVLACSACWPFGSSDIQKAENILQNAIDQLAVAPGDFQAVINSTIAELNSYTEQAIQEADTAVKDMETNAAGLVDAEAQCSYDSIGIHAHDALNYILQHDLERKPAPAPTPWVCLTNPTDIQVSQGTAGGPYTLTSAPEYQIYGFNFDPSTLPTIDYYRASGQLAGLNVVTPSFHTAYELDVNLQAVSFNSPKAGDYLQLKWPDGATGANTINIILHPYAAPPPPISNTQQFEVVVHANEGQCVNIQDSLGSKFYLVSPWTVDTSHGDQNHPGVSQVADGSNNQARATLRSYNYQVASGDGRTVQVSGTICGANWPGPGASFDRQYLVYETAPAGTPTP